jgi:hypothetical protein
MDCFATYVPHSLFLPVGTCIIVAFFGLDGLGFRVLGFCLHTYALSAAIIASSSAPCPSFYCNVVLFITTISRPLCSSQFSGSHPLLSWISTATCRATILAGYAVLLAGPV